MSTVPTFLSLLRRVLSSITSKGGPRLRTFTPGLGPGPGPGASAHTIHPGRPAHSGHTGHSAYSAYMGHAGSGPGYGHVRIERGASGFVWSWNSILRATALPSLGYLFGWNSVTQSNLNSSGKASVHHTSNDTDKDDKDDINYREKERERRDLSSDSEDEGPDEKREKREKQGPKPKAPEQKASLPEPTYDPNQPIYCLMNNPALFDPLRPPRNPIVLAHGLYGFDVRNFVPYVPFHYHYWSDVLSILRKKLGATVIVVATPSTGTIQERAKTLHESLKEQAKGRELNFIGHSMGGLDCRHLITNIRPTEYTPVSLTTVCTPHRGSPFMDWLKESLGLGIERHKLPGVPSTPVSPVIPIPQSIISFLDYPAYSNLTSSYLEQFNLATPDVPNVKYMSVGARIPKISFFHPLWIPKLIMDAHEERLYKQHHQHHQPHQPHQPHQHHYHKHGEGWDEKRVDYGNDCLVTVESAKWGEFLGILDECNHWDIRGAGGLSGHFAEEVKDRIERAEESTEWSWSDWQRFLGAWGEDKSRRDRDRDRDKALGANKDREKDRERERVPTLSSSFPDSSSDDEDEFGRARNLEKVEKVGKVVQSIQDPSVKKEIAEKVIRDKESKERSGQPTGDSSAMDSILDWVVENVPGIETVWRPGDKDKKESREKEGREKEEKEQVREKEKDANRPPRFDLEKFYLALGRKLYDEGL